MTKKDLIILLKLSCHLKKNVIKILKCYNKIIIKLVINLIIWAKAFSITLYIAIYSSQKVIHSNIWLIYWFRNSSTKRFKKKKMKIVKTKK